MSVHDLIDHGLTALMPSRARHVAAGGDVEPPLHVGDFLLVATANTLLVGGIGTALVGGAMQVAGKPNGVTLTRVGAVLTLPPILFYGGTFLKRRFTPQPTIASAPPAGAKT